MAMPKGDLARTNVGSIVVKVSKQDTDRNSYLHNSLVPGGIPGDWEKQALISPPAVAQPSLQMTFKNGTRMLEADRINSRVRLRRPRQGKAPWATFTFFYREQEQLRAAGLLVAAQDQLSKILIQNCVPHLSHKRAAPPDHVPGPKTGARRIAYTGPPPSHGSFSRSYTDTSTDNLMPDSLMAHGTAYLEDLSKEDRELQIQAERARIFRLETEATTDAIIHQARLECEKAVLQHQIADNRARAAVHEVNLWSY
ncbi:MAG: hypothetical protein Q9218_006949 [Villophora microphyllina]